MKYEAKKVETPPQFTPVEIKMVLETQKELDAFTTLAGSSIVGKALYEMGLTDPFEVPLAGDLQELGGQYRANQFADTLRQLVTR